MPTVKVIENWADVTGRLVAIRPNPDLPGYLITTLAVSAVKAVPGFANLFESATGQTIEVNAPAAQSGELERTKDGAVSWRIRKAGPSSVFVHPEMNPAMGDL